MFSQHPIPYSHIMLEKNKVFVAQGPIVQSMGFESVKDGVSRVNLLTGHKARITCMRLFPIGGTSLFRSSMQDEEHVLVTSSSDRTIRIWWKGRSHRCLKGHNGPVTTLVDTLLGNCESKVLASGGEDCTVRLWSVGGKHHPIVTFHGHAKPVSLLSAAKALLWDMRKNQAKPNPNAVAELEHGSLVNMLHMDSYKVVTGGPLDYHPNIWETDTGLLANQLDCRFPGETQNYDGLSAMGVYGSCIVTSGCYEEQGVLCFRDFSNCSVSLSSPDEDRSLKFWEPRNSSDSEDVDSEFENLNGYLS
ncbi:uncharacterized protein A4U43_C01F22550 [Asparagus officinalis]|uniref:Uncharacterized protein n=1 Tax=Asparagus officinalis TaxID=4686 RepID=A0A5P1FRK8_ASPOF|nr:uncharacterized protein A4U43_C01F22550 [Asparagus officinalis]